MRAKAISYIRFSTPEQAQGDGYRRQYEATKDYCIKHGLELDEAFYDKGVSAFKGKHRNKGELRRIIEKIENGEIPKGSTLIVESLDRLSRENVVEQMTSFLQIIQQGISIVTLADGVTHSEESLKNAPYSLMMALGVMVRANEESELKSKRLASAWQNKRKNIGNKPLTKIMPHWLKLEGDKITVREERAEIVREIFDMALKGMGRRSIANELNKREIPSWGGKRSKTGLWPDSYVAKILENKAVIGEFQPHKKEGGKRVPLGEAITDYYPPIVDKTKFYAVQDTKSKRKGKGGRSVDKARNLFSGICYCGICGTKMVYLNKGNGWEYLCCQRRNIDCDSKNARYHDLEKFVVSQLLHDQWSRFEYQEEIDISFKAAQLAETKKQIDNVSTAIAEIGHSPALLQRLQGLEQTMTKQEKDIEIAKSKNAAAKLTIDDVSFLTKIHSHRDKVDYRLKVKKMVQGKIKSIHIGERYCIKLLDGRYCIGGGDKSAVYEPWQLNPALSRKVICYTMVKIKDVGHAMKPSLVTLKKGEDLLSEFQINVDLPNKGKNKEIAARYQKEIDDFSALTPRVVFSDGKASWGEVGGLRKGVKGAQKRAKSTSL